MMAIFDINPVINNMVLCILLFILVYYTFNLNVALQFVFRLSESSVLRQKPHNKFSFIFTFLKTDMIIINCTIMYRNNYITKVKTKT